MESEDTVSRVKALYTTKWSDKFKELLQKLTKFYAEDDTSEYYDGVIGPAVHATLRAFTTESEAARGERVVQWHAAVGAVLAKYDSLAAAAEDGALATTAPLHDLRIAAIFEDPVMTDTSKDLLWKSFGTLHALANSVVTGVRPPAPPRDIAAVDDTDAALATPPELKQVLDSMAGMFGGGGAGGGGAGGGGGADGLGSIMQVGMKLLQGMAGNGAGVDGAFGGLSSMLSMLTSSDSAAPSAIQTLMSSASGSPAPATATASSTHAPSTHAPPSQAPSQAPVAAPKKSLLSRLSEQY